MIGHKGALQSELMYRGSRDGFLSEVFHPKIDGKGDLIIIVKTSTDQVFGGFSSKSWGVEGYQ
jgi:hypothetical protein